MKVVPRSPNGRDAWNPTLPTPTKARRAWHHSARHRWYCCTAAVTDCRFTAGTFSATSYYLLYMRLLRTCVVPDEMLCIKQRQGGREGRIACVCWGVTLAPFRLSNAGPVRRQTSASHHHGGTHDRRVGMQPAAHMTDKGTYVHTWARYNTIA